MDSMVKAYCDHFNVPTFSLFNSAFDAGIATNDVRCDARVCFSRHGRVYTGFRHFPVFDLNLEGVKAILMARDPRDMLVSMYYSVTKSHVVPRNHHKFLQNRKLAAQMDIDEFSIERSKIYLNNFRRYRKKLPKDTLTTYRYEDVIYQKAAWLKDLIGHLALPADEQLIHSIAQEHDVFPQQEDSDKHIRQVHPGNYKKKLKPETIAVLNEKLGEFLHHFNYA